MGAHHHLEKRPLVPAIHSSKQYILIHASWCGATTGADRKRLPGLCSLQEQLCTGTHAPARRTMSGMCACSKSSLCARWRRRVKRVLPQIGYSGKVHSDKSKLNAFEQRHDWQVNRFSQRYPRYSRGSNCQTLIRHHSVVVNRYAWNFLEGFQDNLLCAHVSLIAYCCDPVHKP